VLALRPNQALQIKPNTSVTEAAQLMAAKREDCVLVTDDDERIAGIFTAKDLAFRVVGAGLKANNVTIAEIMTKNPLCAKTDTSATDALDLMVRKGFRHLPVMDENHDISGILDITKCFYDAMEKLERAYSSSKKLYDALEGVQAELGSSQPQQVIQYVEAVRQRMSGPTLESVLNGLPPTTVSVRTSVKERYCYRGAMKQVKCCCHSCQKFKVRVSARSGNPPRPPAMPSPHNRQRFFQYHHVLPFR
jgi:predicted transcriptional regulator